MTLLRNMRISGKLALGFGLLLAIMVTIAVFAIVNMRSIENSMDLFQDYPIVRYNNLNDVKGGISELRRLVATMSFRLGDTQALTVLNNDAQREFERLMGLLDENLHSLRTDESILPERRNELVSGTEDFQRILTSYRNDVVADMFGIAMGGIVGDAASRERADDAFSRGIAHTDTMIAAMEELLDGTRTTIQNRRIEMSNTTDITITTLILLSVVGAILGIAFALLISRMVSKPINDVAQIVDSVSSGNININFQANLSKDETGVMTQNVYNLVSVIKDIIEDLGSIRREYTQKGDMSYRIDTDKYQNSFKEVVESVNGVINAEVKNIKDICSTLNSIGQGDFDVKVTELPGDFVMQTQAVRDVISNLKNVSSEVVAMIAAIAAKGDLSFRIETDKYTGDWRKITSGLNDIAKAVSEPIEAVELCLSLMQKGTFNFEVVEKALKDASYSPNAENYSGVFRNLISAVDTTIIAVSSYISEVGTVLSQMADGDLRVKIEREYVGDFVTIKNSMNNISSSLNKTMSEISSASQQVLSGAKQISQSAMDLANGAQEQASSVEELNATIDIINQQTRQNADSAMEASELSNKSTSTAQEGNASMKEMVTAMSQIKESSSEISKIIRVIQDIAFQTNLLALNAAVEAARAGEHGKGFSVVAEEVRSLAGRSQESASETTGLIETSNSRVAGGANIVEATSQSLDMIVKNAGEVSELIRNISIASKEQAEAVAQVSQGLSQISSVTQSNSAVSEEAAAASEELNSQAEILQQLVSYFKL